ncbi:hypothetical protein GCM10009836_63390 [Pseudonocardia ailaonensis]|uniref:ArpA protein n=1 Tax=Pseudonocardia ailaonensis TaxID=367279 RepID=A0ABN2NME9_9PSEU
MDLREIVDTGRFPLDAAGGAGWTEAVGRARAELGRDGCTVLRGFVRAGMQERLREEGVGVAPHAYREVEIVNVYNTDPDPALPADHPGRRTVERGNAFVPRDRIPADLLISRLYGSTEVRRFVAACVEVPEVHALADPLAGLCLNVVAPGREHPWHFDTNEFAVSLLTRAPEGGGAFEYVPGIRAPGDERFADVAAVLDGRSDRVRRLVLQPGDLQIFRGRYALHRVTAVQGRVDRHTAILSYSARPGVVGGAARTRQLFGRLTPAHLAGERSRVDELLD